MNARCILTSLADGSWRVEHSSRELGEVQVTAASRGQALEKVQRELQFRLELCPCSGASLGTVELQVVEGTTAADK